jgi:hypothetical protein
MFVFAYLTKLFLTYLLSIPRCYFTLEKGEGGILSRLVKLKCFMAYFSHIIHANFGMQ